MALTEKEYCTLATVKAELGITGTSDDDYLESLIKAASRKIDNFCNREFWYKADATHKFAFRDEPRITVPRTPVKELTSVVDSESTTTFTLATDFELEDERNGVVYFEKIGGDIYWRKRGVTGGPRENTRKRRYTVTYAGGYETPEQSSTGADALPEDIQRTCVMLVTDFYRNKGANPRVKRRHLLEAAVWFDNGYTEEILFKSLRKYRRLVQA